MRQLLTPRMIQSMEILQLPLQALEERIEQELQANPVLEMREGDRDGDAQDTPGGDPASITGDFIPDPAAAPLPVEDREGERALSIKTESGQADDFERLSRIESYLENEEFATNSGNFRGGSDGERDKKMDAMNNTAARGVTLTEHLLNQWAFVECAPATKAAGAAIINNIDPQGYLRLTLEDVQTESKYPLAIADLQQALALVQTLEPAGVGARNLHECLLIQLKALEEDEALAQGHDFPLERALISGHMEDLKNNRYPLISRKLGRPIEEIQAAVKRLSRLQPFPGKQISPSEAPPITPDAIITYDEDTDNYEIAMAHDPTPSLYVSGMYRKMLKDRKQDKATREFLTNNVRNARWLIESIEQRRSTIMRVIRVVVDAQREFFDKGPEFLKPLPMIHVAEHLGIHVATVSRAVHDKWIQTPRGVYPLRRFFSGGTTSDGGEDMSWDAVKEKLKTIIANEDKHNPFGDDVIVDKLKEQGIELARRTVAKYRKILNIPTARHRRAF